MNNHTYIYQEGIWQVLGKYFDTQNEFDVMAETSVIHLENEWILESHMQLIAEESFCFYSKYRIKPSLNITNPTQWISENPSFGLMNGLFMITGDTILSQYQSPDGFFRGYEMFLKLDDEKYLNRGYTLKGDLKLASWEVVLSRIEK